MKYDVYVQGQFHKTVNANNMAEVKAMVERDIKVGAVSGFDPEKETKIKVLPKR